MSAPAGKDASGRVIELDIVRGFAIVLVVLGHAVQWTQPVYDSSRVFTLIYSFHMALFFFVSGIANARAIERPLPDLLASRARGLLLPFFSWWAVAYAVSTPRATPTEALLELLRAPDVGLWFLWVLFWTIAVAALVSHLAPPRFRMPAMALAGAVLWALRIPVLGVGLLAWYFPCFAAGALAAPRVIDAIRSRRPRYAVFGALAFSLWLLLALGWHRTDLVWLARLWADAGLPAARVADLAVRYLTASAGIIAATLLVSRVATIRVLGPACTYLGRRTLDVYVSHTLLLTALVAAGVVGVPLLAASALILALLLARALSPVPLLGTLLYGRPPGPRAT